MTKHEFFSHCFSEYKTEPDYPFEGDFVTAVMRHKDNKKWYAIVMRVSRGKFTMGSDEAVDVVNLKLPLEMFGSFGEEDGVYPAYHMNKLHWISVILEDAEDDLIKLLVKMSFEATKGKRNEKRSKKC